MPITRGVRSSSISIPRTIRPAAPARRRISAGADIVGISKDSVKSHAKFAGKYGLKVILGSDESGAVCEAFGVWVEKSMYGRNYMGIERATFLIDAGGRIARVWRKVKVANHAAEVLEAVKAL